MLGHKNLSSIADQFIGQGSAWHLDWFPCLESSDGFGGWFWGNRADNPALAKELIQLLTIGRRILPRGAIVKQTSKLLLFGVTQCLGGFEDAVQVSANHILLQLMPCRLYHSFKRPALQKKPGLFGDRALGLCQISDK